MKILDAGSPAFCKWSIAALCLSLACNALILSYCLSDFALLQDSPASLSGRIDWRGGLREARSEAPLLALLSVAGALFSVRLAALKRIAIYSAITSLALWATLTMAAHFVRTSLR